MEKQEALKVQGLVDEKIVSLAKMPENNPTGFEFEKYSVTLVNHDYAAKTPVMWNACYQAFGITAGNLMVVANTQDIHRIFEVFRKDPGYLGGGAGVGFKDEAVKFLDEIDPLAENIGAVNIIVKQSDSRLKGFNTDGLGFAESLEEKFSSRGQHLSGKKIVMLGSGGTGNAIAFFLAEMGARLVIINRTVEKAKVLAGKINSHFNLSSDEEVRFVGEEKIEEEVCDSDAIVNVSTKGATGPFEKYSALAPGVTPVTQSSVSENLSRSIAIFEKIPRRAIVCDVVLRPEGTPFLKQAKERGLETLDGVPMVVYQGFEAFWLLHGQELEEKGISRDQVATVMKKAANFN